MDTLCGFAGGRPTRENVAHWQSERLQRQRAAADALPDPAARLSGYTRLQETVQAAAPYVPLLSSTQTSACSPFVGGFYLHPIYQFDFASYWKQ
jgi:ABC-type transport system substrate-binding protein